MYVGQFKNSQPWGQGTLVQSDGEKYEGQFVDGRFGVKAPINGMTEESTKELFKRVSPKVRQLSFSRRQELSRPGLQ